MKSLRAGLVTAMTASAIVILPMSNTRVTRVATRPGVAAQVDPKALYAPQAAEFWLSADEFGYIRPGLKITVNRSQKPGRPNDTPCNAFFATRSSLSSRKSRNPSSR